MTTSSISKTQQDSFLRKVNGLDLSMIKEKILLNEHYNIASIDLIEKWYKRFLFLNFKYPNKSIVPNELIDLFWHTHILDTRKYANDCLLLFGEFLHHFPYFGMRGEEDRRNLNISFEQTKRMFFLEFGEIPFTDHAIEELLSKDPNNEKLLYKAASCSDCSGEVGTGTN